MTDNKQPKTLSIWDDTAEIGRVRLSNYGELLKPQLEALARDSHLEVRALGARLAWCLECPGDCLCGECPYVAPC